MQEHDFILNYARLNPAPKDFTLGLDWQYILRQARYHNIAPLLHKNIKGLPISKDLEKIYTYTAYHNMLYLEELQQITERINAIVLKGPRLATDIYGNIGLRPFVDLDLLIQKEELEDAISALSDMGYTTQNKDFYKKHHFLMPFKKNGKIPITIDLQWEFVDKFILHRIDMDKVWIGFTPEMNILYLLLHIEKHAFFNKAIYDKGNPRDWLFTNPRGNKLIWFTDLYELIKRYGINLKLAEEWGIQNIVYYNLYILNKLYPIPGLENLPQPRLGPPKRLIYNMALKNTKLKMDHDIHLRPIRAVDLVNYLFPPVNYHANIIHLLRGLKEILKEFLGICRLKLSTKKGEISQSAV